MPVTSVLISTALIAFSCQPVPPAAAETVTDAVVQELARQAREQVEGLAWLHGLWRGPGTMFGRPSEATLDIRPVCDGTVIELNYRAGGFEGHAFYRPRGGSGWTAEWTDNRGVAMSIHAEAWTWQSEPRLVANWRQDGGEEGTTAYRLGPDGRLHVTDRVRVPHDNPREFANHVLSRTP